MPNNYPAIVFGDVPLIEGGPDPMKTNNAFQRFDSHMFCDAFHGIVGVKADAVPCVIEYYLTDGETMPIEESLAQCSGTLKCLMEDGVLKVWIKAFRLRSYPGDVDSDEYLSRCPPPSHVQVTIVGLVGRSQSPQLQTATALRSFELKASVWDAAAKSVSFTITCFFPQSRRWENTKSPNRGALVSVTGEVIGVTEREEQLCVLLQAFDYISTRGTVGKVADEQLGKDTLPPTTPKKNKWSTWGTPSPRSKRPAMHTQQASKLPTLLDGKVVEELDLVNASGQLRMVSEGSSITEPATLSDDDAASSSSIVNL